MQLETIDATLAIFRQIAADGLAELGYRSVICNRPESESSDQPNFGEIKAAAKTVGL